LEIKWSRDRWRHVTTIGQGRDPNTLRTQLKTATIANNYCCEALRSAIPATVWLLVFDVLHFYANVTGGIIS